MGTLSILPSRRKLHIPFDAFFRLTTFQRGPRLDPDRMTLMQPYVALCALRRAEESGICSVDNLGRRS